MATKKSTKIAVRCLDVKGDSNLLEWQDKDGVSHRGYVPTVDTEDDEVDLEILDKAIPYGVPWAAFLDLSNITPQRVEQELHKRGIWTLADLQVKDRQLIRIGTDLITKAVRAAAKKG